MAIKTITHSISGVTNVISIRISESYNSATAQAQIVCETTSLDLGDSIGFNMGFQGDSGKIFQGYVREIRTSLPDATTIIICEDELSKASEYFMASDRPDVPFSRSNIQTEDLVEDILNEASITNFGSSVPLSVTWGTLGSVELNLATAWQAAKTISDALAWHIYADRTGKVWLVDRPPYWKTGDSSSFTWNTGNADEIMSINYSKSVEDLRNRVVVYGRDNLSSTSSTSSPYLPAGFYKTAVIATPVIDTQSLADQVSSLNLTLLNRLTESVNVQVEGDYRIEPRKFATITDTYLGISGDWFIYAVEHTIDRSGYVCNVSLVK